MRISAANFPIICDKEIHYAIDRRRKNKDEHTRETKEPETVVL